MNHLHKIIASGVAVSAIVVGAVFAAPRLVDPAEPVAVPARLNFEAVRVDTLNLAAMARAQAGCRRAELADMGPGRHLLMAWFDNRASLLNWFGGGLSQQLKDLAIVSDSELAALAAAVPDVQGPVLATLTVTTQYQPRFHHEHPKPPIVSFSSELYQPVAGGSQQAARPATVVPVS